METLDLRPLPRILSASDTDVFFEKPDIIYVDEDRSVRPPPYGTIAKLVASLKENGPLITLAKIGPPAYTAPPFKLAGRVSDKDVYGWKAGQAKTDAPSSHAMIVGARKIEEKAYVYFTLVQDITRDTESLIRGYKPSAIDSRLYIMSYENFLTRALVDLHPICPYGKWLFSIIPCESILDGAEGEAACKGVGQKIFEHYKSNNRGNSSAGLDALVRICEAALPLTTDGKIRKAHIERAWNRIGDDNCRFMS